MDGIADLELLAELSQLTIGGVMLIALIVGLMQFAEKFGLRGKALMGVAFAVATLFGGVAGAIGEGLIPAAALPWIRVTVMALGFAVVSISAMGLYDVAQTFKHEPIQGEILEREWTEYAWPPCPPSGTVKTE